MSRLTTTTNNVLLPKVVDTILNSNVLFSRIVVKATSWRGRQIEKIIKVSKNSQGSSFDGLDTFDTGAVDNRIKLSFNPKFYEIPVVVPLTELAINRSDPNRLADLASLELESSADDATDDLGTMIYADGTGNSSKNLLGLGAIVDDGNSIATYGGQSRSTYSGLAATVTASGGTLSLTKMATLYNAISSGSITPTIGVCDETVFSLYESLLESKERISREVNTIVGGKQISGAGFTGLYYKGFPILSDEKATAQTLFFLNERFLEFRGIPVPMAKPVNYGVKTIEGNDITGLKGLGFSWSDWIIPANQAALIGHIYFSGEFWSSNPKRHGKLTGILSV